MATYDTSSRNSAVNGEPERRVRLPKHILDVLYGQKYSRRMSRHFYNPGGLLTVDDLNTALTLKPRHCPWLPEVKLTGLRTGESKAHRSVIMRLKKTSDSTEDKGPVNKYLKYDAMIAKNSYGKIGFVNSEHVRDILPTWCQDRLRTACRSARFELPFDKRALVDLSPLQFLAKYTRLYREQRRRYSRIFAHNKSKMNDYIEYQSLFPAFNSMFGMFLSERNFKILCTSLFIDKQTLLDETTFIGVCAFADRLFWTSYLEYMEVDTFTFLGPNRSVLEYADFENLKRKLEGLNLSKELLILLRSLA